MNDLRGSVVELHWRAASGTERARARCPCHPGYTLVEMLTATVLTLTMMLAVTWVFGSIGESVSGARATMEMSEAARGAVARLRADLDGITVPMGAQGLKVPVGPEEGAGYFEYTEGQLGPVVSPLAAGRNSDAGSAPWYGDDSTVGDIDDYIMITTRSKAEPFVGRFAGAYLESPDAEVAWFVRGSTLYRRQLLVAPDSLSGVIPARAFHDNYDVSVRAYIDPNDGLWKVLANSLADLTRPENRFAHLNNTLNPAIPYHPHRIPGWAGGWSDPMQPGTTPYVVPLNLPLLGDRFQYDASASQAYWEAGAPLPPLGANLDPSSSVPFDAWLAPHPWKFQPPPTPPYEVNGDSGALCVPDNANPVVYWAGPRVGEDIILTNVLSFDVKVWDAAAPIMVIRTTRSGVVSTSALLPGDSPQPAQPNNPDAPSYTGYAQAVARAGTTITDNNANPPITYQYYDDLNGNGALDAGEPSVLGYGAYVDLGYGMHPQINNGNLSIFSGNGSTSATLLAVGDRVYDTWSRHYEANGVDDDGDGTADEGTDGFDNDNNGLVDDPAEWEVPPPYMAPLRGMQIKIRVFEPDSRQIREVTVVHEFLGK